MGILNAVRAGLEEGAKRIKAYHGSQNFNPQLAGRHPSDNADMSALQLAPHMAKGLINDVVKYGSQAVTGEISDGDFLQQQPLTGQAKTIADAAGSAMGTALNYKVPSLMRGSRSIMDDISVVADGYRKVKPSLVNAFGESNVNRGEGAGLLGSMFIPAKIPKAQSGGLFSQAVIASDKLQRKTGNADGFFNDLTGKGQVKPDELNAMGFKENFAGRQDVSRQEVQQFVSDNQLQIKETVLGRDKKAYGLYDDDDMLVDTFATKAEADAALDAVPQEAFDNGQYMALRDIGGEDTSKFGDYTLEGGDNYREILLQDNSSAGLLDELNSLNKQIGDAKVALRNDTPALLNVAEDMQRESDKFIGGDNTKENYDNYQRVNRELSDFQDGKPLSDEAAGKYIYGAKELIERRDELARQKANLPEPFINSGHFDEPNILAHLRMKDRVDADGNKTLLIEEAQSDWHQKGADVGYKKSAQSSNEIKAKVDEFVSAYPDPLKPEIKKALDTITGGNDLDSDAWDVLNKNRQFEPFDPNDFHDLLYSARQANYNKVPDAPFKTDDKSSWYNLAMKRGLLEAVEGGYDKLALTTGRQQADRYDLSKSISEVRLGEAKHGGTRISDGKEMGRFTVSAFDKNNNPVIMETIDSLDDLPNLIGKDAAKSLVDQPLTDTTSGSARILAGQDLSVGGEGMKQFYDRTLPNTLGKLVKQDGVKVGKSELPRDSFEQDNALLGELGLGKARASDTVHSIDITPKMRERVKKGLPLFATGGAAIGLGELMRQQQQERDSRNGVLHSL